ncbi:MAG: NADH-quinone oxidoreductase subunit D [Thermoleophilia bacterium]|nr:NADH-quinone oxidoreductase subunit D [Thermoleophilia bacterium]
MSTTRPAATNFPLARESREATLGAAREARPLTPTERAIANVEAYTPQEAVERTLANEMLADTRPGMREPLILNLGPNHPSTHGVLRLIVELDGEIVRDVTPVVGYLHTGIEKQCETKTWWQAITLVTRMDYLAPFANITAYTMSVETLLDLEVPTRAQWIRVLLGELNRVASHLVWLATTGLELGAMSVFFYCYRERDDLLDLFEMVSGERMNHQYFQVGGCAQDLPPGFLTRLTTFVDTMPARIDEYEALLTTNPIWKDRLTGVGVISAEQLVGLGVTGPTLRAAGVPYDLRKVAPYSGYEHFHFDVPTETAGDSYARYLVRVREMRESLKIIRQVIDGMPEGPTIADDRKVVLPPRAELAYSMEALIHHFKLVSEGFMVPAGEAYCPIESPRGEMGCYVVSDGGPKPYRVHMRDPSFVNLQAVRPLCVGHYLADLIAIVATLDPVMGGVDR